MLSADGRNCPELSLPFCWTVLGIFKKHSFGSLQCVAYLLRCQLSYFHVLYSQSLIKYQAKGLYYVFIYLLIFTSS